MLVLRSTEARALALAFILTNLGGCGSGDTKGAGGASGAGGSGGSGMPVMINGCDSTTAIDKRHDASTTVTFAGIEYTPRCVRVSAGSSLVFQGNFTTHPLVGGTVNGSVLTPDPASAVPATSTGEEVTFSPSQAGAYPYYCAVHATSGMTGAIFVE